MLAGVLSCSLLVNDFVIVTEARPSVTRSSSVFLPACKPIVFSGIVSLMYPMCSLSLDIPIGDGDKGDPILPTTMALFQVLCLGVAVPFSYWKGTPRILYVNWLCTSRLQLSIADGNLCITQIILKQTP